LISYKTIRSLLFKLDPERAHGIAEKALRAAEKIPYALEFTAKKHVFADRALAQELLALNFANPVGIAAGFDKNGVMVRGLSALGFGFIEAGTVTPKPQSGNPKPRLWRHAAQRSLQNGMGFNNGGVEALVKRLAPLAPFALPLGVNIGKNRATPIEKALDDYIFCAQKAQGVADFLTLNISSPNTPNLRDLQCESFTRELFAATREITHKPIFLKIAPDLEVSSALEICFAAIESGASGIIAANTTNDYSLIEGSEAHGGGLSGAVLTEKSRLFFDAIARELFGKTMLISCGGIMDGEEAWRRITLGASLVQIYTGLIYAGSAIAGAINKAIAQKLEAEGFSSIKEAVGCAR
jgi:dihydroorotate dehydrogenase